MSAGRVYIGEDVDDEFGFLSGRFSAFWESDTEPVRFEEGPKGASMEEAIAWGRRRADVVLIQLGDDGLYRCRGCAATRGRRGWRLAGAGVRGASPALAGAVVSGSNRFR